MCVSFKSLYMYSVHCKMVCILMQVPYEDLLDSSELLIEALKLRRDYCQPASHSFPATTARFLRHSHERNSHNASSSSAGESYADVETVHQDKMTVEGISFPSFDFLPGLCKYFFFWYLEEPI